MVRWIDGFLAAFLHVSHASKKEVTTQKHDHSCTIEDKHKTS